MHSACQLAAIRARCPPAPAFVRETDRAFRIVRRLNVVKLIARETQFVSAMPGESKKTAKTKAQNSAFRVAAEQFRRFRFSALVEIGPRRLESLT